jgi:hypothetical protein
LADTAESEPTKPSKAGFVGFEGATPAECPEIAADPDPAELARVSAILNRAGVRIMALEGGATIGVWSDLDGPEVRAALRVLGSHLLPVRYLGQVQAVPRGRRTRPPEHAGRDGAVQANLMQPGNDIGGPTLGEYPWGAGTACSKKWTGARPECPGRAVESDNGERLFQEQGATGEPANIAAETVQHGERNETRWSFTAC